MCQGVLNDMDLVQVPENALVDEFFKKNCFRASYKLSNSASDHLYWYQLLKLPVQTDELGNFPQQIVTDNE